MFAKRGPQLVHFGQVFPFVRVKHQESSARDTAWCYGDDNFIHTV